MVQATTRVSLGNSHNLLPDDNWVPLTGWALEAIGRLADQSGRHALLSFACRSRPRWRQCVFMALALGLQSDPGAFLTNIGGASADYHDRFGAVADALPDLSPKQILQGCFERPPTG